MKKIIGLVLFSTFLIGCSNASSNESIEATNEETSKELVKSGFEFTVGVDNQNISYADTDNYMNIEGISHEGNNVYIIYDGTVLDIIEPDEEGLFNYSSRSNDEITRLVFSDDTDLSFGDTGIKTSSLTNSKAINVYPNEDYIAQMQEETEEVPVDAVGLNEEGMVVDSEGNPMYSVTITKATNNLSVAGDYSDVYTKGKPENTLEVTYEYKNYSYGSLMEVKSQFINVYGADGMAGEKVGMQNGQTEVPEGKSATATTWYVMPEPVSDLTTVGVTYGGDFSLGFDDYIYFEIPLE